jgi:hypothetical protein
MVNAALGVIINRLSLWPLQNLKHWSLNEVLLQLCWVIPNYFSCSLVAMSYTESGPLYVPVVLNDSAALFFPPRWPCEQWGRSPPTPTATTLVGRLTNGSAQNCRVVTRHLCGAGWLAKPRWLQWVGGAGMFAQNVWYFLFYTLGS